MFRCLALIALLTAVAVAALAQDPDGIYGVKTHDPLSEPPATLFHFTADGSSFTTLGVVTLEGQQVDVDGLAVDADGRLIGIDIFAGGLVRVDRATGLPTAPGVAVA